MESLDKIHSKTWDVYALWVLSAVFLALGLYLPVITFQELIFKQSTFTIMTGITSLWDEKQFFLAMVIFVFSVVFPLVKLGGLAVLWFLPLMKNQRNRMIEMIGNLGKWSMLDVYVVAMTVIIAKSSALIKAKPQEGIYYFCASVALSIVLSLRIKYLAKYAQIKSNPAV